MLCASVFSLIRSLSGTFTDADHSQYIAGHWTEMLQESVRRIDAFRDAHPEHPILDVQYDDLVRAPVETVRTVYGACGVGLDDDALERVTAYVAAHPKDGLGAHRYDLSDFGLDASEIRERFAGYIERYEVPTEPPR